MAGFLIRRLIASAVTLMVAALVIFLVMEVLPGDPAAVILGTEARPDTLQALRAELGLDRPAAVRFFDWVGGFALGQTGQSYTYSVTTGSLILERLAVTAPLTAMAVLLSVSLGVGAGIFAALRRGRAGDWGVILVSQIGVAIPNFWLAILLILVFAVGLGMAPAGGFPGWGEDPVEAFGALILPALALALPQAAILARVSRTAMLEVMGKPFVVSAKARGFPPGRIIREHVLPNASIPIVTLAGLQISFLIAGAVIIENVFFLPGIGRLVFQAIAQRDLILVQDIVLVLAAATIFVNLMVDLAAHALDPRVRDHG
ncbi:MAG: ABC transporter permease [Alphaproteobacteria bacterium]|nr:ABC transporter permease [Alphaproteobacteria bacterium]